MFRRYAIASSADQREAIELLERRKRSPRGKIQRQQS
jgi:hypothetical protein